jgi:predicted RNA binding protein YcfA (HicA-like mRNA interferase family)
MSKKQKLLDKLCAKPQPKGFSWENLVTLMRQNDFTESCEGGSHYIFEHATGLRLVISKTHPSGVLKSYQVRAVKEALTNIGVIGDGNVQ